MSKFIGAVVTVAVCLVVLGVSSALGAWAVLRIIG